VFSDEEINRKFRVRENDNGNIRISRSWYHRLTPFSDEVKEKIKILYEDLAAGSQIHGILFQDDAYLAENEDYHPQALDRFNDVLGREILPLEINTDPQLAERWSIFKTKALINFIECLKDGVRKYRPDAKFARNLYAEVLLNPYSQVWFAQNYNDFLDSYDFVMVMAYPQMELAEKPIPWLQRLVKKASTYPSAMDKTIFKIQTYEWKNNTWIDSQLLLKEMRSILSAGGRHIAYYPDNLWENGPDIDIVNLEMSDRTVPKVE
jgi:biofilm PGA synthesis lipoprotein PgaB